MISFENVSKQFPDGTLAAQNVSLDVHQGETLVLLGRSGSGKTTMMKMINRLVEPDSGTLHVDGTDVMSCCPMTLRRKIGYAIQSIGLFPHMTVGENIALGPKLIGWDKAKIDERVDHLLTLIGLDVDEFKNRYPRELSGGQRQRVGVARALGGDPPIILMDEPFGALDPITRSELQQECIDLFQQLEKTVVFVTHDVFEAVTMGDRIALLDEGKLIQVATPAELVESPANEIAYQFIENHRFQLSLLTRTLRSQFEHLILQDPDNTPHRLCSRDSLLDALDLFKRSGKDVLPVYTGNQYHGCLTKHILLDGVIDLLMHEKNEEAPCLK